MNIYRDFYLKPELKLEARKGEKKPRFSLSAISNLFFSHEWERSVLADCNIYFTIHTEHHTNMPIQPFFSPHYIARFYAVCMLKKIPNLTKIKIPLYCVFQHTLYKSNTKYVNRGFFVFARSQVSGQRQRECCQDRKLPQKHWRFGWPAFSYDSIVIAFLMPASGAHR